MKYVEIAVGSPRNRGLLIPQKKLSRYLKRDDAVYRSTYLYDENALDFVKSTGSIKDYFGKRWIDKVLIDVDKKDNTDERTLDKARAILLELDDEGIANHSVQPYYSGTGYHLVIAAEVFNFKPHEDLPYIVKETMKSIFDDIDISIYMRTGIYRLPHTLNLKQNRFKVPLDISEMYSLKAEDIINLAKTPRLDYKYRELIGEGELEEHIVTKVPDVKQFNKVSEPNRMVPCVQTMLNQGPKEGERHKTLLRIASHYKRHGLPSEYAKVGALHWNNNQMEKNKVVEVVEATYNNNYRYGCNDEIMHRYCRSNCVFFKRRDYLVDVKNALELQESYKRRMAANFEGRKIQLTKMLGLDSKQMDVDIYPGELVTIFGPTGSNKTTFAQNLALGYDTVNDTIRKEWQIPTLFLSLELSDWYMHRRNLQVVSDRDKEYVNQHFDELFKEHEDKLSHMTMQTVAPTIAGIQEKVRELQPALVVVDYIDLIDVPKYRSEYEAVKLISHSLSNMAVNEDIIVIQISQISREYSRNDRTMDLHAGKGSGAIENASRKVIGLEGSNSSNHKRVSLFKNTDGELFNVDLLWTPSFRMKRSVNEISNADIQNTKKPNS